MNATYAEMVADVADAVGPIFARAKGLGPRDVQLLINSLRGYAEAVESYRENMPLLAEYHCSECGRCWTVPMTVKEERNCSPDNCPACFNASRSDGSRSRHTEGFRYLDEEEKKP